MAKNEKPEIAPVIEPEKPKGFELKVPVEELRKRKIFLATPMYGGQCAGMFTRSVADLSTLCTQYGIQLQIYFLFNESLITRARNYCVDEFLRSDATHLMFIDSDIGFNPNDVIALLAMQDDESEYDVIGGPYPKKCISWEKIKLAVDKGVADQNPNVLERFVGDYVFNPKGNQPNIPIGEPCEVREIGTGFMMVRRKTFEEYAKKFPELSYRPDHVRTEAFDGSREIHAYFDCIISPDDKRYLSEDYMFCYNVQKAGMKVWFCPWMQMSHVGSYVFGGSLADLASIGATATADVNQLKAARAQK
jgi:glycosyltransferase involved in cell wall biosynthesis